MYGKPYTFYRYRIKYTGCRYRFKRVRDCATGYMIGFAAERDCTKIIYKRVFSHCRIIVYTKYKKHVHFVGNITCKKNLQHLQQHNSKTGNKRWRCLRLNIFRPGTGISFAASVASHLQRSSRMAKMPAQKTSQLVERMVTDRCNQ